MPTPSLFADDPIDRAALADLAARSLSREQLDAGGWRPIIKSTDLFSHGYTVIHWIKPGVRESEVLEYVPRTVRGDVAKGLPRVTLNTFADQATLHRAVGAKVTAPGVPFTTGKKG